MTIKNRIGKMQATELNPQLKWQEEIWNQKFSWAVFEFNLIANEKLYLPEYKGSTLRGGFGNMFRRVVCTVSGQGCQICILNQTCPYAYVFETPNIKSLDIKHFADNYPHPFIIEPPLTQQKEYSAGEELVFRLILIGKSISFLPYFIYTYDQLGHVGIGKGRGKYSLTSVYAVEDLSKNCTEQVYDNKNQVLNGNFTIWDLKKIETHLPGNKSNEIHIDILTPLRIVSKKKLVERLSFEIFIRNLMRRISLLGKIHCNGDWDLDYHSIIQHAKNDVTVCRHQTQWCDWERYSSRQKTKMKLGGIMGRITFQGNIQPFLPLIYLGQFVHVGKNTTFGLGKYQFSF